MLIVFDLDDTLIDTSGAVTPFKMKQCLQRVVDEGFPVADFAESYRNLLAYNDRYPRSSEALSKFLLDTGFDMSRAQSIFAELTSPLPSHFIVPTTPEVKEILSFFRSSHKLALVTGGHPPFQLEKLKKAGLDTSIFSKIDIPEDSIKKPCYLALSKEFSIPPENIWVCGDRVQIDLAPANDIGCKTVHMQWGRGKENAREEWIDYSISALSELKGIIQ